MLLSGDEVNTQHVTRIWAAESAAWHPVQGGQYTVEGTLVSASHPDAVFALLSDFDNVADVFGSILESRTSQDSGNLHLTQACLSRSRPSLPSSSP